MRNTLILLLFVACQEPKEGNVPQGDPPVPDSTTEDTDSTGSMTTDCVSEDVGQGGGTLIADGATLVVPAYALFDEETLSLCGFEEPGLLSKRWEIRPIDLDLENPATLTLGHTGDDTASHLFTPAPNRDPVRNLEQQRPTADAIQGPVYRTGDAWVAHDLRLIGSYIIPELGGAVDMLFVVDNSCSMFDEQAALAASMSQVIPDLLAAGLDFHAGVVSTDLDDPSHQGKLRTASGVRWIDSTTPNPADVFAAMVSMGTTGSGAERGLGAALLAIEIEGDQFNAGFVRPDADLAVIVLSDESDETHASVITPDEFIDWLDQLKSTPDATALHGIVSPPGGPYDGTVYIDVATATGGEVVDIGQANWGTFFDDVVASFEAGAGGMPLEAVEDTVEAWWLAPGEEQESIPDVLHDVVEATVNVTLDGRPSDEIVLVYEPL